MIQRLILEDEANTYSVLVESTLASPVRRVDEDFESYDPDTPRGGVPGTRQPQITPELRVKLADVHRTIQGYTQYAIGAFKDLAIAEVEEINPTLQSQNHGGGWFAYDRQRQSRVRFCDRGEVQIPYVWL